MQQLLNLIRSYESCAVAFSAGVDSTVVAYAAYHALGENAVAVTGVSSSLPEGELEEAKRLAALIGIRHEIIETQEFENDAYLRNEADRCYHCKTELYQQMEGWLARFNVRVIANGVNADDLSDYRPGLRAASEHQVRSPLAECGLTKQDVRQLAAQWELPVWDKPASPCLSSRVAYGERVTPERLQMIDSAERFLKSHGLSLVRVRYHTGDLARIEVGVDDLVRLNVSPLREELLAHLKSLGFRFITLDLDGFRSGSLNALVQLRGEGRGARGEGGG